MTTPLRRLARVARRLAALAARGSRHFGVGLLGMGSIVLVRGGIPRTLSTERDAAIQGAYLNATNLARAFEENIVRSLNAVDQTLLHVRDA